MTGAAKNTVLKLLADLGAACAAFLDKNVRGVKCKRIQCDEIWSFCHAKEKNVPEEKRGQFGYGSVWTWTGIDAETKLLVSHLVGLRDADSAQAFIDDLAGRVQGVPQITTDGLKLYVSPIAESFGEFVDYAMLIKMYGPGPDANSGTSTRYSPAECIGAKKEKIMGEPDMAHVSTSYVERANLTIRMMNRRFTRLTNAFSKKIENHMHAFALYAFHYNYVRIHQTLRQTPAMAAGLSSTVWSLEDMVGLVEAEERRAIEAGALKRGKYRPRISD
jgi:IS1 family transposase